MSETSQTIAAPPKLGLTRVEAAKAIGQSPATIDRLTKRGLLRPSRATRRPIYFIEEIQRFLRETTALPLEGGQP
jgi:predicted urease superfamily metal-dependent hydrolase